MTTTTDIYQLSERFNRCFESFDAGDDLFADDTFFDLLPPLWRFQFQGGGQAFTDQLRSIAEGPTTVKIIRTLATESGFVTEHEEHQEVGDDEVVARRVWLCEVRDGRIADVTGYCNGGWDGELRARHAAEAPMLR
jgi:ketosteroid isomerase-like protein